LGVLSKAGREAEALTDFPIPPPSNSELEQALLGGILLGNGRGYEIACEIVRPEHFYFPVHAQIFEAIGKLLDQGKVATPITLKPLFEGHEALANLGGASYLIGLAKNVPTVDPKHYALSVRDYYVRREMLLAGQDSIVDAQVEDYERPAEVRVEAAIERLSLLIDRPDGGKGLTPIEIALQEAVDAAQRVYQANGKIIGVPTGLIDLDRVLGGLQNTDLIIIAGRPAMGKTALATNIAENAARQQKSVAFFSLEMSQRQLAGRILAGITGITAERQRGGPLTSTDVVRLSEAAQQIRSIPIHIDDTAAASVAQLKGRAKRFKRRYGLDLIVVDYLQLLVGGNEQNRVQEVSKITRDLKVMAKDLGVPVVALSQLSRALEQREDKRPMLSDLRESGSIEQDADVVMFCYREEYYLSKQEPQISDFKKPQDFDAAKSTWLSQMADVAHKAEILIRKNRHGRETAIPLRFDGERTRFDNLAYRDDEI
jgi:replicative DNA helicase